MTAVQLHDRTANGENTSMISDKSKLCRLVKNDLGRDEPFLEYKCGRWKRIEQIN